MQVELRFPDKENARILIGCSNGKNYSMDALMALDEAGYQNLVGLRGGYYAWNRCIDVVIVLVIIFSRASS